MSTIFNKHRDVFVSILIIFAALAISYGLVVLAQEHDPLEDIIYPIAELGNCENEADCLAYCNEIEHLGECILFAEAHDLLTSEELEEAEKFLAAGAIGPGGCTSHDSCDLYCNDIANIDECLAFGEEHDLIPADELEEARKVAQALREGAVLPGGCTSKDSCEVYCSDEAHIEECILFAEAAGLIPADELEEVKKFLAFIKAGGQTPGGCVGERECEAYCEDENHFDECIEFAAAAGFIPPEELELIRKTGGRGPGGCKRDECATYCNDPANQEECFAFAKEHGLISPEDLLHAREGFTHVQAGLEQAPPEVRDCLKETIGEELLQKIETGESFTPSPDIGEKMRGCFNDFSGPGGGLGQIFNDAPSEVLTCIESRLGTGVIEEVEAGNFSRFGPESEQIIGGCFREFGGFGGPAGPNHEGGQSFEGGSLGGFDPFTESPPEVLGCLATELGFERYAELRDTDAEPTPLDLAALKRCYAQFGVQLPPELDEGGFDGHDGSFDSGFVPGVEGIPSISPEVEHCLLKKLGIDYKDRLFRGELDRTIIDRTIQVCIEEQVTFQIQQQQFEQQFEQQTDSFVTPEEFHKEDFTVPDGFQRDIVIPEEFIVPETTIIPEETTVLDESTVIPEETIILEEPSTLEGEVVPTTEEPVTDTAPQSRGGIRALLGLCGQ